MRSGVANGLLRLIASLVAPIFLSVTGDDLALAKEAAIDTINDFHARSAANRLAIGRIIVCGLASVQALIQSMQPGVTFETMMRLQRQALALDRAAEQARRSLGRTRRLAPLVQDYSGGRGTRAV